MPEFVVRKQGRLNYSSWSTRVLTLDIATGVVKLSRKGHPESTDHHAMYVTSTQMWPHYNRMYVEEGFDSLPAKLTIRLRGLHGKDRDQPRWKLLHVNSAGIASDEAWVLRFTSFGDFQHALLTLAHFHHHHPSQSDSPCSGGATTPSVSSGSVSPSSRVPVQVLKELLPIRQAWYANRQSTAAEDEAALSF
ncbi:hypothetical protein NESM_000214800 [Novymonas esmeraldas]|uniref:Uncharacterized protein n=1 Tax=Novymonas esmeraldas TaxID=1808958 RepID=A0AAW0F5R6_9TRYP